MTFLEDRRIFPSFDLLHEYLGRIATTSPDGLG